MRETRETALYRPQLDESVWATIQDFVTEAVLEAAPKVTYPQTELFQATSRLAAWCHEEGIKLERDHVFTEAVITKHVQHGLPSHSSASRGNRRSQLRRIAEALLGEDATESPAMAPAEALAPYTDSDVKNFRLWAGAQAVPETRSEARVILALGLGGGLSAGEIADVRASDILVDEAGAQVFVRGVRPRLVQSRREWESFLVKRRAAVAPDDYVVRPGRKTSAKNFLTNLVARSRRPELGPQSQRMRATWLVHHLAQGTPSIVLVRAAGIQSLDALTRYLKYVPDVDPDRARSLLRA